ncbi:MAG: glycosyltransferase family 2 protein [Lachnospiraceae bacterium]|nr:glycosyltransferase family 2 protein [Lachnospiraceae bacterium]
MEKPCLSIVVPCYNEESVLDAFYEEITKTAESVRDLAECEFLFVDDGSKDSTLEILKRLSEKDERVSYISFSRNFGKESGIYAGLSNAVGDYVVLMDADLQHPPCYIPEMLQTLLTGEYDSVAMRRVDREGEGKVRSWFSKMFYKFNKKISGVDIVEGATDYRMMTRQMVNAVLDMPEYNRFTKGIFAWVGFRTKWIGYHNVERAAGETKWSFGSLVKYSINGIVSFSTVPLAVSSFLGVIFCFFAFLMMIWLVIKTLVFGNSVSGYPTIVTLILFMSGLQLMMFGVLGQYVSRSYMEGKHRPIYIAREKKVKSATGSNRRKAVILGKMGKVL